MTRFLALAVASLLAAGAICGAIVACREHGCSAIVDALVAAYDAYLAAVIARHFVFRGLLSPDTTVCILGRTGGDGR